MLGGAMWLDLANGLWVDYSINTSGKLAIYTEKDKPFLLYVIHKNKMQMN